MPEYLEATGGLNVVKAVYMEVDVDPARIMLTEADHVIGLCRSKQHPTVAAVIGVNGFGQVRRVPRAVQRQPVCEGRASSAARRNACGVLPSPDQ